jgi:hypothetical protein
MPERHSQVIWHCSQFYDFVDNPEIMIKPLRKTLKLMIMWRAPDGRIWKDFWKEVSVVHNFSTVKIGSRHPEKNYHRGKEIILSLKIH